MTTAVPSAKDAETQVVGACLIKPALIGQLLKQTGPRDFLDPFHKAAVGALVRLHRERQPIDIVTVKQSLERLPQFKGLGSAVYLAETGQAVTTIANFHHHLGEVKEASRKRQLYGIAQHAETAALNGQSSGEILADMWASIDDLQRDRDSSESFTALTAAELNSGDFTLTWLVDWLLVEGQPCIVAGPKKTLKTSLLLALMLALATGNEFLGKFTIRHARRVLFCSGESGLATLQETSRRIARAMGWELKDIPNFTISTDLPQLNSTESLTAFESFLEEQQAEVVAIDPTYLCMGSDDSGNLFAQGKVLMQISKLCQRLGVTLVLCHHTKKNTGRDPFDQPELEDIAWAGFQEFARQWLLIGRRERYEPGSGEHRLWLSVGGSAGHGGLWALDIEEGTAKTPGGRRWDIALASATEAHEQAQERKADAQEQEKAKRLEADKTDVCRVLARHPQGLAKTSLGDHAGISRRRWPSVLAALLDSGEVVETELVVGNHKKPITGYKLNTSETT